MTEPASFVGLIERVRQGDQDAAAEIVRRYEPAIRRAARLRLADSRLIAVADSTDICQAVLGSFFVRAASGEYDLDHPQQLLGLLLDMTRKKVAGLARAQQRQRRDRRRQTALPCESDEPAAPAVEPWRALACRELLEEVNRRLTPSERELVQWRNEGRSWAAIAALRGRTSISLRKELSRALGRVARELHLEEDDGG